MKKHLIRVLLHLLLWAGVWFYFYYFFSYNSDDRGYVLWFASLLLPLTIALTYFAIYFLIPRYLFTRQYGRFALFSLYTLMASSYLVVLIIYGCMFLVSGFDASQIPPMVKNFFFILILVYLVVGLVSFITILNRSLQTEKSNKELQHKILNAQLQFKEQELNYLKKQIHPHFLFNTLNTIYGLAIQKSNHTPDVILKLSNLLDYILYQVDKPRVALEEEVAHIQEYIALERIRFQDSLKVEFKSKLGESTHGVAPMVLIPLVENAFKHGEQIDGYLHIHMAIELKDNSLDFSIKNSIRPGPDHREEHGLGLENFRKRLDLHYPDAYHLQRQISEGWYCAQLRIFELENPRPDDSR